MKQRLRFFLIVILLALATLAVAVSGYEAVRELLSNNYDGWGARRQGDHYVVKNREASVHNYALQDGDEIATYNGEPFTSLAQYEVFSYYARRGDAYRIMVRRSGELLPEMTLSFKQHPPNRIASDLTSGLFVPFVTLAIAIVVFALKPYDRQANLLVIVLSLSATNTLNFFTYIAYIYPRWLVALLASANFISAVAFSAALCHLFLVFPQPSPLQKRVPRLISYIYLSGILLAPIMLILSWRAIFNPEQLLDSHNDYRVLSSIWISVSLLQLAGALVALLVNYRHADKLARRKLRVVLAGTLVAYLPLLLFLSIVFLLINVLGLMTKEPLHTGWLVWLLVVIKAASVLMPLSFAYAIVKHQVIPVSLIVRRGLQYLLAKNALRALIALPVVGILWTIAANPNRTLTDILFRNSVYFYLLLFVAPALGLLFRRRLSVWIDRKFFREAYNQEQILRELLENVKHLDSIPEMSRHVTEEVERALHPTRSYLFYRAGERRELSLTYSSGGASQELSIPEEFRLLRFMEDAGAATEFPFPPKNNLPQAEKVWLEQLSARLIVPMCGTDGRLAGLFLLGDKRSEVPYTAGDRALLEAVAGQTALVYENVRLKERVAQDRKIKHEVLARVEGRDINLLKECPACGACYDSAATVCEKDRAELTLTLPVERTIDNRYRLDRLIGRGGMGAVYEAWDTRLSRPVAVKILTGAMFGNPEALRRFEREARSAARIHHPHIVTVHDYGTLETEGAYLVMELARGETLGACLRRDGSLAPPLAANLFAQILSGIAAAHEAGVVHRDLKPENILLSINADNQMTARILDFGLAKITHTDSGVNASTQVTTPGTIMGTFGYMSPEQLTGGEVDERSDLFSIGVMVVEAITGGRPFSGKTYHELLTNVLQTPFHLTGASPAVRRLDAALQKCLAKERAARFASAAEMGRELIPALRACPPLDAHELPTLSSWTMATIRKKMGHLL